MTQLGEWPEALYRGALTIWPDLTREEFLEAAQAWMARRQAAALSLRDPAVGIEAELRARYGPPAEEVD